MDLFMLHIKLLLVHVQQLAVVAVCILTMAYPNIKDGEPKINFSGSYRAYF